MYSAYYVVARTVGHSGMPHHSALFVAHDEEEAMRDALVEWDLDPTTIVPEWIASPILGAKEPWIGRSYLQAEEFDFNSDSSRSAGPREIIAAWEKVQDLNAEEMREA